MSTVIKNNKTFIKVNIFQSVQALDIRSIILLSEALDCQDSDCLPVMLSISTLMTTVPFKVASLNWNVRSEY